MLCTCVLVESNYGTGLWTGLLDLIFLIINNLQISHSIIISLHHHQEMNFTFVFEVAIVHIFMPPLKLKQQSALYVIQKKRYIYIILHTFYQVEEDSWTVGFLHLL